MIIVSVDDEYFHDVLIFYEGFFLYFQFQINHGQKFTKAEILQEIFNIVAPSDFYPVCYTVSDSSWNILQKNKYSKDITFPLQQSKTEDYFLVRQSRSALIKLFQKNLRLKFKNDQLVYMTVKLDIAHFKLGHIYPAKVFQKAMTNRFNALVTWEGAANVLNLDAFASGPEFISVEVDLNNAAAFQLFCTTLDNKLASGDASAAHINGIRLSNNNLQSISAFDVTNLQKIRLQLLDLRHNEVSGIDHSFLQADWNSITENICFYRLNRSRICAHWKNTCSPICMLVEIQFRECPIMPMS